jgi:hypothetical protein
VGAGIGPASLEHFRAMNLRAGVVIALIVAAIVPASSLAAKVELRQVELGPRPTRGVATEVLVYTAAKGEKNVVGVAVDGFKLRIGDTGAEIKAGRHCKSLTKHKAVCTVPMTRRLDVVHPAKANLKDGDDRITGSGIYWNRLKGGSGDDRLKGGSNNDFLEGGTGSDLINGRGGEDDLAFYTGRTDDLKITLRRSKKWNDGGPKDGKRGKRDRVVGVEGTTGGKGDDVLRGTNAPNGFTPMQGEDTVFALGGIDFVDLGLDPQGGGPPDGATDSADCGDGVDNVQGADAEDELTNCE